MHHPEPWLHSGTQRAAPTPLPGEEATPQPSSHSLLPLAQGTRCPEKAGEAAPLQGLAQPPLCPEQEGGSHFSCITQGCEQQWGPGPTPQPRGRAEQLLQPWGSGALPTHLWLSRIPSMSSALAPNASPSSEGTRLLLKPRGRSSDSPFWRRVPASWPVVVTSYCSAPEQHCPTGRI